VHSHAIGWRRLGTLFLRNMHSTKEMASREETGTAGYEPGFSSFMLSLNPRIPSAMLLPSSGNFFGPKNTTAMAKMTSKCWGRSSPSIMYPF